MFENLRKRLGQADLAAAAAAGLAGGGAFVATLVVDNAISGKKLDDLLLLGRPAVRDLDRARLVGLGIHTVNSVALGVVYAAFVHDRLPGPAWLRGTLFATVENTLLYPLTALDRWHPAVRSGEIDTYWSWSSYIWTFPRHAAYGAVTSVTYETLRRDTAAIEQGTTQQTPAAADLSLER